MNANPKFLNATAAVDEAAVQPLPAHTVRQGRWLARLVRKARYSSNC